MPPAYVYHPVWFFLITLTPALGLCPLAAYLSNQKGMSHYELILLLLNLCVPALAACVMIYASQNESLRADFWSRLLLFKIKPSYLLMILFLMPCVIYVATLLSLFFGYSTDQFSISKELSVMKGWTIFGLAIPLIFAPLMEELGWRGYGVDSLKAYYNIFTASALFGILWAVWHLPAFFIKGYYHNQLLDLGILYVVNFFLSVFVMAFLMNWVYYKTGRSIPAIILFHSCLNLFSMLHKTDPFTKCIATLLLCIISLIIIVCDYRFFFKMT